MCRTSHDGGPNSLGYEPYCATPLAPETVQLSRQARDCSRYLQPRYFGTAAISTREPTTGAHHPRQTSTRPRVQHQHYLTPGRNLPRYPDLGVETTETIFASQQDRQLLRAEISASHEIDPSWWTMTNIPGKFPRGHRQRASSQRELINEDLLA